MVLFEVAVTKILFFRSGSVSYSCLQIFCLQIFYAFQGLFKFGLYEVFKVLYSDLLGEENSYVWRTSLYLAASASAEFFADIALSPMEAAKVCLL